MRLVGEDVESVSVNVITVDAIVKLNDADDIARLATIKTYVESGQYDKLYTYSLVSTMYRSLQNNPSLELFIPRMNYFKILCKNILPGSVLRATIVVDEIRTYDELFYAYSRIIADLSRENAVSAVVKPSVLKRQIMSRKKEKTRKLKNFSGCGVVTDRVLCGVDVTAGNLDCNHYGPFGKGEIGKQNYLAYVKLIPSMNDAEILNRFVKRNTGSIYNPLRYGHCWLMHFYRSDWLELLDVCDEPCLDSSGYDRIVARGFEFRHSSLSAKRYSNCYREVTKKGVRVKERVAYWHLVESSNKSEFIDYREFIPAELFEGIYTNASYSTMNGKCKEHLVIDCLCDSEYVEFDDNGCHDAELSYDSNKLVSYSYCGDDGLMESVIDLGTDYVGLCFDNIVLREIRYNPDSLVANLYSVVKHDMSMNRGPFLLVSAKTIVGMTCSIGPLSNIRIAVVPSLSWIVNGVRDKGYSVIVVNNSFTFDYSLDNFRELVRAVGAGKSVTVISGSLRSRLIPDYVRGYNRFRDSVCCDMQILDDKKFSGLLNNSERGVERSVKLHELQGFDVM